MRVAKADSDHTAARPEDQKRRGRATHYEGVLVGCSGVQGPRFLHVQQLWLAAKVGCWRQFGDISGTRLGFVLGRERYFLPVRVRPHATLCRAAPGICRDRPLVRYRPAGQDLTVNQSRVLVEYRVRIEEPKSRNGNRTLPLDSELMAALTVLRKRQLDEGTAAGEAYRSGPCGLDWYQGGEYVITDEAGTPVHPEWCSGEFGCLLGRAGLRRITLHDPRHTTLTLIEHAGVPISKWAGH
jgi:hypothetical protein